VCGGVGRGKVTVANGNHTIPGTSHRVAVTSDGAENAPRLKVLDGEDSQESSHHWSTEPTHTPPALTIAQPRFLGDGVLAERE